MRGIAKTEADYYDLAEARGFEWLGPMPNTTKDKTWWRCGQGHRWQAQYANVKHHGSGCPACVGKARRTPDDYRRLAAQHRLKWLGPMGEKVKHLTWWKCSHGHQFESRYLDIQQDHGCAACYGNAPLVEEDFRALAEARGLRWLGPELVNSRAKTGWQCGQGHRWQGRYDNIQQGHGCPVCYEKRRGQASL